MKKRKKKGVSPLVAVAMLLVGGAVAGKTFLDMAGAAPMAPNGPVEIVEAPEPGDQGSSSNSESEAIRWNDLLAEHGSFDGGQTVRVAFAVLEEARSTLPSPTGEMALGATQWEGPDPPQLPLGVVMISEQARRAVLGGRVVGVRDEVAGVVVQSIARDRVVALWGTRLLTYDLDSDWPREFRAELERRSREAQTVGESDSAAEQKAPEAGAQEIRK